MGLVVVVAEGDEAQRGTAGVPVGYERQHLSRFAALVPTILGGGNKAEVRDLSKSQEQIWCQVRRKRLANTG